MYRFVLITILVGLITACDSAPAQGADIRGTITQVNRTTSEDTIGSILVDVASEPDTTYKGGTWKVYINRQTVLLEQLPDRRRSVTFADLQVGQWVQARFTGPVATSLPPQVRAGEVIILK